MRDKLLLIIGLILVAFILFGSGYLQYKNLVKIIDDRIIQYHKQEVTP